MANRWWWRGTGAQILLEGALLGLWLARKTGTDLIDGQGSSQAVVLWLILLLLGRPGATMAVPLLLLGLLAHSQSGPLAGEDSFRAY